MTVAPAATHAASCTVRGSGLRGGRAGESLQFVVEARDAHGNRRTVGGDQVDVSLVSGSATATAAVRDNGDGTYTVSCAPTLAGEYSTQVLVQSAPVRGSPFNIAVGASRSHTPLCTLSGDGLSRATVGQHATFRIATHDRYNNPTVGAESFHVELRGPSVVYGEVQSAADSAMHTVTYTTNVAGAMRCLCFSVGSPC